MKKVTSPSLGFLDTRFVSITGDTMTGALTLPELTFSDGAATTVLDGSALDTAGNWIGLSFYGAAGFNDSNDYYLLFSDYNFWDASGYFTAGDATHYISFNVSSGYLNVVGGIYADIFVELRDQGDLRLREAAASGSQYTGFQAPASLVANVLYTLPAADGNASEYLQTDGSGNLSWAAVDLSTKANVALDNLASVQINASLLFDADSAYDVGDSTNYAANLYADKIYLNATATLDGATAGQVSVVGNLGLEATTATTGIIYSGADLLLHTYGTNTFFGVGAGNLTLTNAHNVGIGYQVLDALTSGSHNIGMGYYALTTNQSGAHNIGIGGQALQQNTASYNVGIGGGACYLNSSGTRNVGIGYHALYLNSTGSDNVGIGYQSLAACTHSANVAVGHETSVYNTSGQYNFALGYQALKFNVTGSHNCALGYRAGSGVTGQSHDQNVFIGANAGLGITTGSYNIGIGYAAGDNLTTGASNIIIGYDLDASAVDVSNELNIGDLIYGDLTSGSGKIEIFDKGDLGSESLNEGDFATHAKWDVTNDITDDVDNKAIYTWSANQTSTLTQTSANLAVAGVGGRWYKFVYTVAVTTAPDGDCAATITTGFAATAQTLKLTAGTHTLYFKSAASPGDFVISIVSGDDTEGTFSYDDLTLKEIQGGDLYVHGNVGIGLTPTANMSGLSVEAGLLTIKETTAPTADTNYGKLWTNTSDELWFQDGAGANHLLHGDAFSNIWFHGGSATVLTISTEDAFTLVDTFAVVGHEDDSGNVVGSASTNNLTLSARGGGEYEISYHASLTATGASKEIMTCVGVTLATPKDITNVTDDTVSPIVITSTAHGLNNGDMVEIAGVLVNTAANGSFIVANKTTDTFEITTLDGSATTGNGDFDEGSPTGDVTIWYLGNMVARRDVSQTALGSMSATGLHILQHSDVVCLYMANLDDTNNINIYAVSLDVDRIGD